PCARVPSNTRSAVLVSFELSNGSPSSIRSSSSAISSWILQTSAFVLAAHTVVVLSRINLSPVTVEKLVWWVRQRWRAYLTLFVCVSVRVFRGSLFRRSACAKDLIGCAENLLGALFGNGVGVVSDSLI